MLRCCYIRGTTTVNIKCSYFFQADTGPALNVSKDAMLRKAGCWWRLVLCKCDVLPLGGGAHLLPAAARWRIIRMTPRRRTQEIMTRIRRRPSGAADGVNLIQSGHSSCLLSIIQSLVPLKVLMDTFGFNSQVWYLYVSLSIHFVVKITVDVLLLISRRRCLVRCEESSKPNIYSLLLESI